MLVLSRKCDEAIVLSLNDIPLPALIAMHRRNALNIQVKVLDVRGDKVRLGTTAANDIPVDRKEVYELKKQKENNGET